MAGACRFAMSESNPNDQIGGGGCACGDRKPYDRQGPYAIFPATSTDSGISPHVVVCAPCAAAILKAADGELINASKDVLDSTALELPVDDEDIPEL